MKIEVTNPLQLVTITLLGIGVSITYHKGVVTKELRITLTWAIGEVEFTWDLAT